MKSRTITISALVAIAVIAVWWLFVFSPARGDAKTANDALSSAKEQNRTLDTQNKQLDDLKHHEREIKTDLKRLQNAVPDDPALASFIDQANGIATATGVTWVSVAPTAPASAAAGGATTDTLQVTISVQGPYYNVLDYLNRLENIPRLVVVDQTSLTTTNDETGQPQVVATLTTRMFTSGAAAAAAATTANGSTTPTSVAGGGGVAAPNANPNN